MQTFKNSFRAVVELRNIGDGVVAAAVSTSVRFERIDHVFISDCILARLLPDWVSSYCLYDGSYVLVSTREEDLATNACVASVKRSFDEILAGVQLEDCSIRSVRISLEQFDDSRCDYTVQDTRFLRLFGTIVLEGEDDEASED